MDETFNRFFGVFFFGFVAVYYFGEGAVSQIGGYLAVTWLVICSAIFLWKKKIGKSNGL